MEELGLPERLFETGYEPTGRKRINNYFNLRWIEVVKTALSDAQQEMLAESQFRQLMLMGSHTFSVMFAHQLLSRQLVTRKLYELWWVFAGKPIRYGIGEFALVTGLNCGTPPTASVAEQRVAKGKKKGKSKAKQCGGDGHVWQSLFGSEETITADWIICRLGQKDKYKDDDTRLRLSLLLLVEAILCPTSGSTQLRPDVVEMVGDIPMFLQYPWGRESFLLTVGSGKIRSAGQLVQDTLAIQGFAHAMVLVTVCSCPQIIASPGLGEDLLNEDLPIEDIVDGVCSRSVKINIVAVHNLELIGQASVRSILCEESAILSFADEVDDVQVNHLVSLIHDGFPFEINTWRGGVKAADAKHSKGAAGGLCPDQGNVQGQSTAHANAECNAGGCDFGERFDVSNFVRLVANELHTRAVPLLRTLKAELIGEIQSVKFEVLASLGGVMEGPRGGNAHRVPEVPFTSSAAYEGTSSRMQHGTPAVVNETPPFTAPSQEAPPPYVVNETGEDEESVLPANTVVEKGSSDNNPLSISSAVRNVADKVGSDDASSIDGPTDRGTKNAVCNSSSGYVEPTKAAVRANDPVTLGIPLPEETKEIDASAKTTTDVVVDRRVSKRLRTVTTRYSSAEPEVKKQKGKEGGKKKSGPKTNKLTAQLPPLPEESTSAVTSPEKSTGPFQTSTIIGPVLRGFYPCLRVNAFRLAGFTTLMHTEREYDLGEGVTVDNKVFQSFFESTLPQPTKAADMVVTFIRQRLRGEGITSYDFLPASFVEALRGDYHQYCRVQDIGRFSFSSQFAKPGLPNMTWSETVEVLYLPFQIDGRHWIGVVIDIAQWEIHILDCNPACLNDEKLEALLKPVSVLMPLLIRHNGGRSLTEDAGQSPMPITRIDLPFLCESTGLSCVATHLLMELNATDKLSHAANLTEATLRIAAQAYAVEAFSTFNPEHLQEFPNA